MSSTFRSNYRTFFRLGFVLAICVGLLLVCLHFNRHSLAIYLSKARQLYSRVAAHPLRYSLYSIGAGAAIAVCVIYRRLSLFLAYNIVVALIILEASSYAMLNNSALARNLGVEKLFRRLYLSNRMVIQSNPTFTKYDRELSYILRPGTFQYETFEFSTSYSVNSAGLRDDQESLLAPEVIFLGDSFTMGWGVESDETFVQIVEKSVGRTVLNAGISSYGTAREMKLLDRLDTSKLKTLVVQYCGSTFGQDYSENFHFVKNGMKQIASSKRFLQRLYRQAREAEAYAPFLFSYRLLRYSLENFWQPFTARAYVAHHDISEFEVFLSAIAQGSSKDLSKVRMIVFEICEQESITEQLCQNNLKDSSSRYFSNIVPVRVLPHLDRKKDFFVYDDHINAHGHRKVAKMLVEAIKNEERLAMCE